MGQHPAEKQSQRSDLLQPVSLPRAQPSRGFFNRIKQCRRVATRYDRLAVNYLAFVQLASIRLWLAACYESTPYFELRRPSSRASPPLILASADVTKMAEGISASLSAASQGARTGDGAFE